MRIYPPTRSKLNPPESIFIKFLHALLYAFAYPLLAFHLKIWYGFSVRYCFASLASDAPCSKEVLSRLSYEKMPRRKARKKLKAARSSLAFANHCCLLDTPMAGVALWPLRLQVLSLAENGAHKIYSPLVRAFGTVFVGRSLVDSRAMVARQRQALEAGGVVFIFPEGNLYPYAHTLHPLIDGIFKMANFYKVALLPVTLVPTKKWCLNQIFGRPGFTAYVGPLLKRSVQGTRKERVHKMEAAAESILTYNLEKASVPKRHKR